MTGNKLKVVMTCYSPGSPVVDKEYQDLGVDFIKTNADTEDKIIDVSRDADFIVTRGRQPVTRKVVNSLNRCRLISVMGIGYDGVDVDAATEKGICVNNVPDASTGEVSDHAMALILACSRRLFPLSDVVKAGKWTETGTVELRKLWGSMSRLRGQTVGLVGFGNVPRTLAPKAKAFGTRVITCDPYANPELVRSLGVELVSFESVLAQSDFVSIHAALTAQNRKMMGLAQFKQMKRTAYLINTARGGLVDEQALLAALDEGYIAGAALDVTDPEPPRPDSPLVGRPNVIVTPHSAHASQEEVLEQYQRPPKEIGRLLRGEWPVGLLNPKVKEAYLKKWGKAA